MSNPVTTLKTNLAAREPVMAGAAATWVLLQVGAILVGRTHLLTNSEWTPLSSAITPIVTGVFVAAIGLLVRRVVTPVEKAYSDVAAWLDSKGLLVDGKHAAVVATGMALGPVAEAATAGADAAASLSDTLGQLAPAISATTTPLPGAIEVDPADDPADTTGDDDQTGEEPAPAA